jgi:zinc protease
MRLFNFPNAGIRFNACAAALAVCLASAAFVTAGEAGAGPPLPANPSKISYPPLQWNVPLGTPYRVELKNGLAAYVAVDSQLPIVQLVAYVRYGTLLDPAGKEGQAQLMATLMRTGGTQEYPADTLDALIDRYAMRISVRASQDLMQFSASFLSEYTDTAFAIIRQMLFKPRFDEKKLEKEKKIVIDALRHRFDNPGPTCDIGFQKALYARSAASALATEQSVQQIDRAGLSALHAKVFACGNSIIAVAGKFDRASMISRLEKSFPAAGKKAAPAFPEINPASPVKCLIIHKPISQVYVQFGLPLFKRPHPDYYPVSVANLILGGGGFTSRLGTAVRSDAGLTYSIHANAESNYTYPADWSIDFFTKNESFPKAMALALAIVDSLRKNGVTALELANAKASLIDEMPSMFRSPFDIASTYAWSEYFKRSPLIFKEYPDSIRAIKREDLQRVFNKYLDPSSFVYTIVGDTSALAKYSSADGFDLAKLAPRRIMVPDSIPRLP